MFDQGPGESFVSVVVHCRCCLHKSGQKFRRQFLQLVNHSLRSGEFLRFVSGRDDADRWHARTVRRFDSGGGILHHDAVFGRASESLGGKQESVRFRFAVLDVASADDRIEKFFDAEFTVAEFDVLTRGA